MSIVTLFCSVPHTAICVKSGCRWVQPAQAFPFYSGLSPGEGFGDLHSGFTGGDCTSKTGFDSGSFGSDLSTILGGALQSVHGVGFYVAPQVGGGDEGEHEHVPVCLPTTFKGTDWIAYFMQVSGD